MSHISTHIVFCPVSYTGHIRPTVSLATNIACLRPDALISFFVLRTLVGDVEEIRQKANVPASVAKRIRVIGISDREFEDGTDRSFGGPAVEEMNKLVPEAYRTMMSGGILKCAARGTTYDYSNIPPPTLAISDVLTPFVGGAIKKIAPEIKLLVLWSTTASFVHRSAGPREEGGLGSWEADAKQLLTDNPSMSLDEAAISVVLPKGQKLPNPEGVDLYDYELGPQPGSAAGNGAKVIWDANWQLFEVADGLIIPTTEGWEPKTSERIRGWYAQDRSKLLFFAGQHFIVNSIWPKPVEPSEIDPKYAYIFDFLDRQEAESTWLVAFGTIFYPFYQPERLYAVVRTLLKRKKPFILARSGLLVLKSAPFPEDLVTEVKDSGLGLIVDFVPQHAVLRHPSIGVFLTHGGMNSLQETVQAGVLPVLWPFDIDQPYNAAYMTTYLNCAFELLQVRQGPGAQPPYRGGKVVGSLDAIEQELNGIIDDIEGEKGVEKRRNFEQFRAQFLKELAMVPDTVNKIAALATAE